MPTVPTTHDIPRSPFALWVKADTSLEWISEPVTYEQLTLILGPFEAGTPPRPQLRGTMAYVGAESLFEQEPNPSATRVLGMPVHGDVLLLALGDDEPLPDTAIRWLTGTEVSA